MIKKKGGHATFAMALFMALIFCSSAFAANVADVVIGSQTVHFQPKVSYTKLLVRVSAPDGVVYDREFRAGADAVLQLPGDAVDGTYTYEITVVQTVAPQIRPDGTDAAAQKLISRETAAPLIQNGTFLVQGGAIVIPSDASEAVNTVDDILHYDDVIITGSLCVGFDCADGEAFGFDTIRLKEHNLRIHFDDTSYTASYPTNSWRITINDSTNGGASYFAIDDVDDGTTPFKIEAGAPSNSLYVEDYGRVGLGTATPVVELHIKDSDTPTLRLEQDGSGGWTPQTWDVAGNESNFFIRDATNGSKLPFRIQPSTPSSTLCLKSDGKVGIGTWSPTEKLEIEGTGEDIRMIIQRTDGATAQLSAKSNVVNIGSQTNHPVKFMVNQAMALNLKTDGSLLLGNGASCTAAGVWTNASSIELKENIEKLSSDEAVAVLEKLNPVKYNYKKEKDDKYVGFIAEEIPELVAMKDRKTTSPMDILAVLTKVVQEQQKTIKELKAIIEKDNKK
jgi:hypothetical protein